MKKKNIKIIKGLWGTYDLPYNIGEVILLEAKLADEMIESGHAMPVDIKPAPKPKAPTKKK